MKISMPPVNVMTETNSVLIPTQGVTKYNQYAGEQDSRLGNASTFASLDGQRLTLVAFKNKGPGFLPAVIAAYGMSI